MVIVTVVITVGATAAWIGWHAVRRHRERRAFHEARERFHSAEQRDHDEEERARLLDKVRRQFPHAAEALEQRVHGDGDLRRVLADVPGVRIGETPEGLPVVLPSAGRTRHLCCWGRTGTGKTNLALKLIRADLEAGRGVVVISAERELFRDHLLPAVPESRVSQLVYLAPSLQDCPVFWNPFEVRDDDKARAAAELFVVFRRSLSEASSIGPQSDPIAMNSFLACTELPGATFLTMQALLEDREFRKRLIPRIRDEWCRAFFELSFERLGRSAARPLLNRIGRLIAAPGLRQALCRPHGNLHLGEIIDSGQVCFADISGFDPDTTRLLGQMLLAHLQIAVMRRERMPERDRRLCVLYADEVHELIDAGSVESWRQMLSKGRRYLLAVNTFSQFPGQIDADVRAELGNCGNVFSFAVAAQDANVIRRELLVPTEDGPPEPIAGELLNSLPIGCCYGRLGASGLAVPIVVDPPSELGRPERGEDVRERSWKRFADAPSDDSGDDIPLYSPSRPLVSCAVSEPSIGSGPTAGPELSPDDQRFLEAVRSAPGRNSSEYAKLARMSGAAALASRQRLVAAGFLREHQVATGRRGRQAIVLEPVEKGQP